MKTDLRFLLVLACFVLSGAAGLIYQTAWLQQFALVFGTSELALVTVLAAYMAGLALGASLAGRWAQRVRRPVLAYAGLELGIGLAALLVPAAIGLGSRLHVAWLGGADLPPEAGSTASAIFYLVSSFAILLVPTALMGATLPLLARWAVRTDAEIGRRIGLLYSANTLGAAAGTLVAAFVLLPRLGLGRTVWVGVAVNGLVFLLAAGLAKGATRPPRSDPAASPSGLSASHRSWILPLVALSGVVSFTWEILWTRLLSHLVGGSVYAFATMLATMLLGLTLGSALAAWRATSIERARSGFAAAQLGIGTLSLLAFVIVDRLPPWATQLAAGRDPLTSGVLLSAATLLPGAIAIGATFPFAVRYLATDPADSAAASARVFAWNTVGAIAGALLAGYLLLPALGFALAAVLAAATSLLLALATAVAAPPRRSALALAPLIVLVALAVWRPETPWTVLRHGPLGHSRAPGEIAYHGVGRSATVMLYERPFGWSLTTNGLPESGIDKRSGRAGNMSVARWLSLLAVAARPDTRSLVVVGLGAGVTVEEVPATVSEIHVVELEPEVVAANRSVGDRRRKDPLTDPRLTLHVNDARGALRLTDRAFDAIVSQPSHPWTSGASHLFTREFAALVRDRLTPSGVFVQWMGLPFVDEELLRAWVATALAVFPHVELYEPGPGGVLLLASGEPLDLGASTAHAIASDPEEWVRHGIRRGEDVLATRVLDPEGARRFTADTTPITDHHNRFQTRAPTILGRALGSARAERLWGPYLPALDSLPGDIDTSYLVRRMLRHGEAERARRLGESVADPVARHTILGLAALTANDRAEAEFELRSALRLDPEAREAKIALLGFYREALQSGQSVSFIDRFAADPERAVIESWQASASGDWSAVRGREVRLAAIELRHPLAADALRLRVGWRVESGDAALARQAIELLEPLLSPFPQTADLLQRARAAAAAGEIGVALASLDDALPTFPRGSELAAQWHQILRQLPRESVSAEWYQDLEARYRRPPMNE